MRSAKEHRQERKRQAITYLGGKCADCGNSDTLVLQFDHVTERRNNGPTVAALLSGSWKRLKKSLDKCELVCANCHTILAASSNGKTPVL